MCKFNNRLFVLFLLHVVIALAEAKPPAAVRPASAGKARSTDLLEFLYNDYNDYGQQEEQIHYDQRQKGEENLHLRMNGFLIELPNQGDGNWLEMLAELYLSNALLLGKSKKHMTITATTEPAQFFQAELTNMPETDAAPITTTQAQMINIPAPKKDVESRQRTQYEEVPVAMRTKSHALQLLQMLRRTRT